MNAEQERAWRLRAYRLGPKQYAGDAVYVEMSGDGDVVLTTEDGVSITNRIVLDPDTWRNLHRVLGLTYEAEAAP